MLRTLGSVVLGYIAMALVVFAGLSLAYVGLGTDRAFDPGVYDVSVTWIVVSIIVGFGAALVGGLVARRISITATGPRALAGVVLVLGLAMALAAMMGEAAAPGVRTAEVGTFDAMRVAQTPIWMMFLNPLIGAVGVLVGGKALGR